MNNTLADQEAATELGLSTGAVCLLIRSESLPALRLRTRSASTARVEPCNVSNFALELQRVGGLIRDSLANLVPMSLAISEVGKRRGVAGVANLMRLVLGGELRVLLEPFDRGFPHAYL